MTFRKFQSENLKILGVAVKNLFAQATWRLGFLHPRITLIPIHKMLWNKVYRASSFRFWQRQVRTVMSSEVLGSTALRYELKFKSNLLPASLLHNSGKQIRLYQNTTIFVRVETYFKRIDWYLIKYLFATEDKCTQFIARYPEDHSKEFLKQS